MIYLSLHGYDFIGEIQVNGKTINVDGCFSVDFDSDEYAEVSLDAIYDVDADVPLIISDELIAKIEYAILEQGDPTNWWEDYQLSLSDYYYDTYKESI